MYYFWLIISALAIGYVIQTIIDEIKEAKEDHLDK